jgi:hypothetical protein
LVHITRDGGKNWTNITPKELPEWSLVSLIEASSHDAGRAYLAVDRHKLDDSHPYIYKTSDFGKTWQKITEGIPADSYVHAVREDPRRPGLLYAGIETGMFVSFDDGARWQPLQLNLPTTPIHDLVVKDDDLVVATHGRSFWILDDLSPLRQLDDAISNSDWYLFKPRPTIRLRGLGGLKSLTAVGENPPDGAILYYYLKSAPKGKQEIILEIFDSQGKLIRKYSNLKKEDSREEEPAEWPERALPKELLPAEAGLNRFAWDLRYEPPAKIPGQVFGDWRAEGPWVLPGSYQVKLTLAGKSLTTSLEVKVDPRVSVAEGDLKRQLELGLRIREQVTRAHATVNQIIDLRAQLKALHKHLEGQDSAKEILTAADDLDKKVTAVEGALYNPEVKASEDDLNYPVKLDLQLIGLAAAVESADSAPTRQSYELFDTLSGQVDKALASWREITGKDLAALTELMRKQNIPAVILAPVRREAGEVD